jgi:hypothetical protein
VCCGDDDGGWQAAKGCNLCLFLVVLL